MLKHIFATRAPFREEVLRVNTIAEYLDAVWHYARMKETHEIFGGESTWDPNDDRPVNSHLGYVGAAGEFFVENYLRIYGGEHDLTDVWSVNSIDSPVQDTGIDHFATNLRHQKLDFGRENVPGSKVFIQTKFARNPRKEFKTNDGSRLPNFFAAAYDQAIEERITQSCRWIVVTTGKGIHWAMKKNMAKRIEVINRETMSARVDGNEVFWNKMREAAGVAQKAINLPLDY